MRKVLRITLYIFLSLILLVVAAALFVNSQWGQNIIRGKAEAYLNKKLQTEVKIGFLGVGFPKYVVIEDVFVRDRAKDTLVSLRTLKVDVSMLGLLHRKLDVQQLIVKGLVSHIYRNNPDTTYNFSFIPQAFASKEKDTTKKADTAGSGKPFEITVNKIQLQDIHVKMNDATGGMALGLDLEQLNVKVKKVALDTLFFHIGDVNLAGVQAYYKMDTSNLPAHPKDTSKTNIRLIADNVHLERVTFDYDDQLAQLLFALKLGGLDLQLNKFDLLSNTVDLQTLSLSNTDAAVTIGKKAKAPAIIDTIVKIDTTQGWLVNAKKIQLNGIKFRMNDENKPPVKEGMDYSHLDISELALDLNDFKYGKQSIMGDLVHLAVEEKSGLTVKELKTRFAYNEQGATLNDLYLLTPNTIIRNHIEVHYKSIATLKDQLQNVAVAVDVPNSVIGFKDILLFAPQLRQQDIFRKYPASAVKLDLKCGGTIGDLNINRLYLLAMNNMQVELNGKIQGLPDPQKLTYDLQIKQLDATRTALMDFVPDSAVRALRIPDRIQISGKVAGTIKDYNTDLAISTTDGKAWINGFLHMSGGKGKETYKMLVQTDKLNVGHIIKKDTFIGPFTAIISASGKGFDPKTMTASVNGAISGAYVHKYNYHDVSFSGAVDRSKGKVLMRSEDPNLRMQLQGTADFSGKYAAAEADINIDSVDLRALHFSDSEFRARATIAIEAPQLNPDYPTATIQINRPLLVTNGKRFSLDSLYMASRPQNGDQNININLGVISGRVTGHTPLTKLGAIIQRRINVAYSSATAAVDSAALSATIKKPLTPDTTTLPANYDLHLRAVVSNQPLLKSFVPGITYMDSIKIVGDLTPRELLVNISIPEIGYGANRLLNGKVNVSGTDSAFTYKATIDRLGNDKLALWYTNVSGNLGNNTITARLSTSDSLKKERFALGARLERNGELQVIRLSQGLKLNYIDWTVAPDNAITLEKGGFYINNFNISNNSQYIRAASRQQNASAPLDVDIANFSLANIATIISTSDTPLADGKLSGKIAMQQGKQMQLDADLRVDSLKFMGNAIGNITAKANNKTTNAIEASVTVTGQGNDILVNGFYYQKPQNGNDLDMQLNVNALALQSMEKLAMGHIRNSSGFIRGKLAIKGKMANPNITGSLKTDRLKTTISTINSAFSFPAEEIAFRDKKVFFNDFSIIDSPSNSATLNGSVDIANLKKPGFDLRLNALNWRAIHSTAADNKVVYGDLYITTNLKVKGNPTTPVVDGSLNILKGTNLTVVTPEKAPQIESRKGIVVITNSRDTITRKLLRPQRRDTVARTVSSGSEINVNVSIDKNAQFSLIIDQASGDFISVRGSADINASVARGGGISLTGNYELNDGAYQLNYNFIKRKFQIKSGSTITFAGDPVKGTNMNVTAVYSAVLPPYDLVQRQVADQAALNYYKQRIPFDVELHLRGQVLQPSISFDIDLPDNRVYPLSADQIELIKSRLNQVRTDTSELNKQVFAVLILKRFVSDDPFTSGAQQSTSTTALQSVSTFIGEQLNAAAGRLVKGVDLSVDLATTDDYTSGEMRQRTDLSLAASKRLLDDRLKLTIGNNFELEGPQTTNQQASYIPSNLAADYLLSPDGKYSMRAYRQAYDKGVLEGYVTETGLNFIVSLDYNKFKNVLRGRKQVKHRKDSANSVRQDTGRSTTKNNRP